MRFEALTVCYREDALWQDLVSSARILGTANAGIRILRSTFTIKAGRYRFVVIVGGKSLIKILSGDLKDGRL